MVMVECSQTTIVYQASCRDVQDFFLALVVVSVIHCQCGDISVMFFACNALQVLKLLYDMEVLEEDAIIMWADEKQMATEDDRKYLKKAATFVSWLREAEAEGSTSDDSE